MGFLTAAGLLPHLLFSLVAGVWLDRVRRRRRLMIAADLGRAVLIATIPAAYALGVLSIAQLYVVGFLSGSLAVAFDLSWNTVFVSVTKRERYVEAMALLNGSRSLAYVGGPTIGGWLVQLLGAPLAMLADAVSYLGSVGLPRAGSSHPNRRSSPRRVRCGSGCSPGSCSSWATRSCARRFSRSRRSTCSTTRSRPCSSCMPRPAWASSRALLGLALGSGAVGGVIGAVVASRVGRRIGLGPAYAVGCLVFPIPLILVPLAGSEMPMAVILALLFAAEFGAGLGVMILDINVGAIISARTPDRIRSRAGGAFRFINYGVRPIGAVLGGALGASLGVREALFVATIAATAGVLWLVGSPVLRLRDLPDAAD